MSEDVDFLALMSEKYGDRMDELDDEQLARLNETFNKKMQKFGDERLALTSTIGSFNFEQNAGDSEEVTIYAVGSEGPRPFNGQTLFCFGVVEKEDGSSGRIVVLVNENDTDKSFSELKELFGDIYNPITAYIDVRESQKVPGTYIGEIATNSEVFKEKEGEDRSAEEIQEFVNDHVPTAQISTIGTDMSMTKSGSHYAESFGVDFKRLEYATVLESNIGKSARYIFQDDSFLEASELSPDVRGDDNEVGLVSWADAETALGTESIVDAYGSITPSADGQPTMRLYGFNAHYVNEVSVSSPTESGGSTNSDDSSSSVSSQAIDERTI